MNMGPLPYLLRGYGLAALLGAGIFALWGSVLAAVAAAWLGGAAFTLGFAALSAAGRRAEAPAAPADSFDEDDAALAAALRRWEAERFETTPGARRA